jgi:hypothetical protein
LPFRNLTNRHTGRQDTIIDEPAKAEFNGGEDFPAGSPWVEAAKACGRKTCELGAHAYQLTRRETADGEPTTRRAALSP